MIFLHSVLFFFFRYRPEPFFLRRQAVPGSSSPGPGRARRAPVRPLLPTLLLHLRPQGVRGSQEGLQAQVVPGRAALPLRRARGH